VKPGLFSGSVNGKEADVRRYRFSSLRTRIIAWFFIPTAIILFAVALVMYFAYQQVTEELVLERDLELTRLSAGQIASQITGYQAQLSTLARTLSIEEDPEAQADALRAASSRMEFFDGGLIVLDTFGFVRAIEPAWADVVGEDWSQQEYYQTLLREQIESSAPSVASNLEWLDPGPGAVVFLGSPIIGERGVFLGAVFGIIRLAEASPSPFASALAQLFADKSGNVYLLDDHARVVYTSTSVPIAEPYPNRTLAQQVASPQQGAERTLTRAGEDVVASYAGVRGAPWQLVIEESWTSLTQRGRSYQNYLLVLLGLGVIIPALVVLEGTRILMQPIQALIDGAKEVAQGHFGYEIHAQTGDEIEELATQFSLMSNRLQESYANLEQKVEDRTRELATLYEVASIASRSFDLDQVLANALDATLQALGIEAGGIYLLDEHTRMLMLAATRGLEPTFVEDIDRLGIGEGFSGRVVESGEPMVVRDISTDPRLTRVAAKDEGFHSIASFPLISRGRVLGALFIITRGIREFSAQDLDLLTSISQQIGGVVANARLFDAVQKRAEQFRLIGDVGTHFTSILAVDELMERLVQLIQTELGYDIVEIGLIEGNELVFRARASEVEAGPFTPFRLRVGSEGITGWVAKAGEPVLVNDVSKDPRYVQVTETVSKSELAVPIKTKDKITGVLNVQSMAVNAFDHSDLAVMQSLADQAAIAIENARLFKVEQRRAEQFRVISEVGRQITSILEVDELLREIVRLLKETFGYYMITVGLIEEDRLVFKAGFKTPMDSLDFCPPSLHLSDKGITAWVASTGEALNAPDVTLEPRFEFLPAAAETRSELAVPIKTKAGVIGVINVESDQAYAFDTSDETVLQSLANQAAVAIENARLYARGRELAVMEERNRLARDLHDAVTQTLFSASLIAEVLPRLWERDSEEGWRRLEELRQLTRGALAEMRTLLVELRPAALAEANLDDLLHQLAEAIMGRAGLTVSVEVVDARQLPDEIKVAFYRIAQEALNNVAKHAAATHVHVSLTFGERGARLSIQDDGRGFEKTTSTGEHLGLGIMEERAADIGADLRIESRMGEGTSVTVSWDTTDEVVADD
jgi:nitrate/nitrite-specific signal transduction histidine kinase